MFAGFCMKMSQINRKESKLYKLLQFFAFFDISSKFLIEIRNFCKNKSFKNLQTIQLSFHPAYYREKFEVYIVERNLRKTQSRPKSLTFQLFNFLTFNAVFGCFLRHFAAYNGLKNSAITLKKSLVDVFEVITAKCD